MKLNVLSKLSLGMLMVCAVMFFVGCSKDKEKKDPDFSHLPIIGVWQTIISEDYDYEVTITMNSNGTGKEEQVVIINGVKYPVDGSPMSFNWTGTETSFRITGGYSSMPDNVDIPYQVTDNGTKLIIMEYTFTKK